MHRRKLGFAILLVLAFTGSAPAQRLIGEGDSWKYFAGRTSDPPNDANGRAWTQQAYDDSVAWSVGPSGFGYSDGDDASTLPDMQQIAGTQTGYASVFIRKVFTVADPAAITALTLASISARAGVQLSARPRATRSKTSAAGCDDLRGSAQ